MHLCHINDMFAIILVYSTSAQCPKPFEEKYTYDAIEADSKLTCRTISLLQVKW